MTLQVLTRGIPDEAKILQLFPPDESAARGAGGAVPKITGASFVPQAHQIPFVNCGARYKAFIGGLGAGKTVTGVYEAFVRAVLINRDIPHVGVICSMTYRHLQDNVIPIVRAVFGSDDSRACLRGGSWETAFSSSRMSLTLWNGTIILFRTLENKNFEKLRGIEFAWVYIDEAALVPSAEPWKVAIGRLRFPGARYIGAWLTTTPRGEDWINDYFILNENEDEDYQWFHARTYDNLMLDPAYIRSMEKTYSAEDAEQELEAKIINRSGSVYKDLSRDLWPNGNLYPLGVSKNYPTRITFDFGYNNPRAIAIQTHAAVDLATGDQLKLDVIVWEWTSKDGKPPRRKTIEEMIEGVKDAGFTNLRHFVGDPAGDSHNSASHKTDVDKLKLAFGLEFYYPKKSWQRSILNGETLLRGRIRNDAGQRLLVWACDPESPGGPRANPYAKNSYRAMSALNFPARKHGQPVVETSHKDGVNDHDPDAIRYDQMMHHGKQHRLDYAVA